MCIYIEYICNNKVYLIFTSRVCAPYMRNMTHMTLFCPWSIKSVRELSQIPAERTRWLKLFHPMFLGIQLEVGHRRSLCFAS